MPVLAGSVLAARRGSTRGLAVWLGTVSYLTYNAVMFCIATPFNRLFPLYVAMLSLSIFLLAGVAIHAAEVGRHLSDSRSPAGSRSTSGWSSRSTACSGSAVSLPR